MKKVLYGSTALVAAGALAAPAAAEEGISLSLGGFYTVAFAVQDMDYDSGLGGPGDTNSTTMFANGEVHFKGETTLDNGITFGVRIELEAQSQGDQLDENYAYIEGSFGRLIIGGLRLRRLHRTGRSWRFLRQDGDLGSQQVNVDVLLQLAAEQYGE